MIPSRVLEKLDAVLQVLHAIQTSADTLGLKSKRMISRAYHDCAFMAQIAPAAMIFVPSEKGLSHHPDEHTDAKDLANGIRTLALTLAQLAGSAGGTADKSEL